MALNFRPAEGLAERLRAAAFITKRSANTILNEALTDWLDGKGQKALTEYRTQQAKKGTK